MAVTPFPAVQLSQTPQATPVPGAVDTVNSNISPNTGKTIFRFKNSGSAATVTFSSIVIEDGLDLESLVVNVPATTGDVEMSGLQTSIFGSQVTWLASASSVTASVTEPG
jgi:hypothetical protein